MKKDHKDIIALILLVVFNLLFAFIIVDQSKPPMEDAAMLMRYAENFSAGHGIVWNIGEDPVDGGTDFLAIIFIGMLNSTGLSIESSVKLLCVLSHILLVLLVYVTSRKFWNQSYLVSMGISLYLSVGPGLYYSGAYFTTSFFALFVLLTWIAALKLMRDPGSTKQMILFPLFALISGLIRPEGAILSMVILFAILYFNGVKNSSKIIKYFLLIFAAAGAVYFLWRWSYFGYPLPNPLYKKGGIHPGSLLLSVRNVLFMTIPFILLYIYGLLNVKSRKLTVSYLIPVISFTIMFIFVSSQMNISGRFQYAIVPVILVSWQPFYTALIQNIRDTLQSTHIFRNSIFQITALIIFFAGAVTYQYYDGKIQLHGDGNYEIGKLLHRYSDRGYTVATSEAGLIPFYSKWNAVDTWGLNDKWIAHNVKINEGYLELIKPEVISFHFLGIRENSQSGWIKEWVEMTETMKNYAETHNYVLAAVYGPDQGNSFYFYVKNDLPERRNIIDEIRQVNFIWYESGNTVSNLEQ